MSATEQVQFKMYVASDALESYRWGQRLTAWMHCAREHGEDLHSIARRVAGDIQYRLLREWRREDPERRSWGMFTVEGAELVGRLLEAAFDPGDGVARDRRHSADDVMELIACVAYKLGHREVYDTAVREELGAEIERRMRQ